MKSPDDRPVVPFPPRAGGGDIPAAAPATPSTRNQIAEYWRILKRRKWGIVGLALVGAMVGGFKALTAVPVYSATTTMLVEPSLPKIVASQEVYAPSAPYLFYETQYDIIRSRALAQRVVEKLDLADRPPSHSQKQTGVWNLVLQKFGFSGGGDEEQPEPAAESPSPKAEAAEGGPDASEARVTALAGMVQGGLSVSGGQRSQIISISFSSPDPELAADIANAAADAYIELGMESRLDQTRRATSWLTDRIDDLRKKLATSEAALQAYQEREGLVDTESLKALSSSRLESLNNELVQAQAKYAEMAKRYGPKHPRLIAAKADVEEATRRLRAEQQTLVQAKEKEFQLAKLEREVTTNRELYDTFLTRFKQTDVSDEHAISNVRVIDRAQIPGAPVKPNKKKILTTSIIFGLLAGIGLAFLLDLLDNTFKKTEDVEEKLLLPVLGITPIVQKRKGERHVPERQYILDSRSSFAESVNHIRTGLLFSNVDHPPKTILVTSSVQSEGKTTLSSNLALALSQLGPTLLVDADLRKPRVAKLAGLEKKGGLVEVVAGQVALKDCVVRDPDSKNLFILKSGMIPPNPLEILSSDRFARMLDETKKHFEHVVIDTAPILPVSDGVVLGRLVDGVILVLKAGATTHNMAQEATKRLRAAKINPLGVVLSQVVQRRTASYYNDSYYYSGYYYGYGEDAPKAK
jgi:succinoglycan biosynthesis transport protein ExoP